MYKANGRKIELKRLVLPTLGNENPDNGTILFRDMDTDYNPAVARIYENVFLTAVAEPTASGLIEYNPILAIDKGLWVEKDVQSYGVYMSSSDPAKPSGGGAIVLAMDFRGH